MLVGPFCGHWVPPNLCRSNSRRCRRNMVSAAVLQTRRAFSFASLSLSILYKDSSSRLNVVFWKYDPNMDLG